MRALLYSGMVLALAACTAPAPLGPPASPALGPALTSAEIRDAVVGQTGTGSITGSTITFAMYLAPDGAALARRPTGIERGQWRLTNDGELCLRWQTYRQGEEYCQNAYREGRMLRFQDTKSAQLLAFEPGNQLANTER